MRFASVKETCSGTKDQKKSIQSLLKEILSRLERAYMTSSSALLLPRRNYFAFLAFSLCLFPPSSILSARSSPPVTACFRLNHPPARSPSLYLSFLSLFSCYTLPNSLSFSLTQSHLGRIAPVNDESASRPRLNCIINCTLRAWYATMSSAIGRPWPRYRFLETVFGTIVQMPPACPSCVVEK